MREAYDETGDTAQSIALGLARTGKLVTSAALVLMFAFFVLSTEPRHRHQAIRDRTRGRDHLRRHGDQGAARAIDHAADGRLELVAALVGSSDSPRCAELGLSAVVTTGFARGDFDRAVALVSAEPSPERLVASLGLDWEYLAWLALDASEAVLGEHAERRGVVVSYGGEAFTAGFLIGVHLHEPPVPEPAKLTAAVDLVQERGRHAVIADHCDLASVARIEDVYAGALVESLDVPDADGDELRAPLTRIFEAGLAVGLELGSGREGDVGAE